MRCRLRQLDGHRNCAVLQLVDHLNGAGLAEGPGAPRQVVESGLLRDEGVSPLIGADEREMAHRGVGKILLESVENFSNRPLYFLDLRNDARRVDSESGREDEKQQRYYDRCGAKFHDSS